MDNFYILMYTYTFAGAGIAILPVLNHLPILWLCDYGESPGNRHSAPRFFLWPWGFLWGTLLGYEAMFFGTQGQWLYGTAILMILWVLIQSAMIDRKFGILPDQHTVLIALLSPLMVIPDLFASGDACHIHTSWTSPLAGSLAGGGVLLLIALLGRLIYKRESIGFGDIKLLFALGLSAGPAGSLFIICTASWGIALIHGLTSLFHRRNIPGERPMGPWIAVAASLWFLLHA